MNVFPVKFRNQNRNLNGGKAAHNVVMDWTVLRGFRLKTSIATVAQIQERETPYYSKSHHLTSEIAKIFARGALPRTGTTQTRGRKPPPRTQLCQTHGGFSYKGGGFLQGYPLIMTIVSGAKKRSHTVSL